MTGKSIVTNAMKLLKAKTGISWKINYEQIRRSNLYVTKDYQTESSLEGYRDRVIVTIYKKI